MYLAILLEYALNHSKFLGAQALVFTQLLKEMQCSELNGKLICAHYCSIYGGKLPDSDQSEICFRK